MNLPQRRIRGSFCFPRPYYYGEAGQGRVGQMWWLRTGPFPQAEEKLATQKALLAANPPEPIAVRMEDAA